MTVSVDDRETVRDNMVDVTGGERDKMVSTNA